MVRHTLAETIMEVETCTCFDLFRTGKSWLQGAILSPMPPFNLSHVDLLPDLLCPMCPSIGLRVSHSKRTASLLTSIQPAAFDSSSARQSAARALRASTAHGLEPGLWHPTPVAPPFIDIFSEAERMWLSGRMPGGPGTRDAGGGGGFFLRVSACGSSCVGLKGTSGVRR